MNCAKVSSLTRGYRADFIAETKGDGAVQRGHTQHFMGRQHGCVTGYPFCDQCGETHFAEKVEAVIAGGAIGTQADIDAELSHSCHRGKAAGQFEIGSGAMSNAAPRCCNQFKFAFCLMHGMDTDKSWPKEPKAV